jgi:hypothetical protein
LGRTADLRDHINVHVSFQKQEEAMYGVVLPMVKHHLRKEGIVSSNELIIDILRSKHKYLRSKAKKVPDSEKIANIRRIRENNRNAEVGIGNLWRLYLPSLST